MVTENEEITYEKSLRAPSRKRKDFTRKSDQRHSGERDKSRKQPDKEMSKETYHTFVLNHLCQVTLRSVTPNSSSETKSDLQIHPEIVNDRVSVNDF